MENTEYCPPPSLADPPTTSEGLAKGAVAYSRLSHFARDRQ